MNDDSANKEQRTKIWVGYDDPTLWTKFRSIIKEAIHDRCDGLVVYSALSWIATKPYLKVIA